MLEKVQPVTLYASSFITKEGQKTLKLILQLWEKESLMILEASISKFR